MISLTLCKGSAATVAAELSFTFINMAIAVKMTAPVTEPMIVKVTFEESAFDGLLAVKTQVALVKTYPVAQKAHWFGPLQEVQLDNVHKKH